MDRSSEGPAGAWAFLWGKRRWRRQDTALSAWFQAAGRWVAAAAVNVSAGGVLLRIPMDGVSSLLPGPAPASLFEIQDLLAPSFAVRLGPKPVLRATELVRVDWRPDEPGAIYAGCGFREPLAPGDVEALGLGERVRTSEAGILARPSQEMPWQAAEGTAPDLEVHRSGDGALLHRGRLVAMHGRDLAVHFVGVESTRLVADLAHEGLSVQVVLRRRVLWEQTAWLLAVRLLDPEGVEVVLQAEEKPIRAVRRSFRHRHFVATAV